MAVVLPSQQGIEGPRCDVFGFSEIVGGSGPVPEFVVFDVWHWVSFGFFGFRGECSCTFFWDALIDERFHTLEEHGTEEEIVMDDVGFMDMRLGS